MTVNCAVHWFGIPMRPAGVSSHPQMIRRLAWAAGRAAQLRGLRSLAVTLVAGTFGVMMILL